MSVVLNRHTVCKARTLLPLIVLLLGCARPTAAQLTAPTQTPADEPSSGVVVVDTSASINSLSGSDGKKFLEAFEHFAQAGGGRDEFALVRVSTAASLDLERTGDSGLVSKRLSKLFKNREVGATALFDGCALALKNVSEGGHGRRYLLVLSDGVDTTSELSLSDLQRLLKESGVKLFAVEVGGRYSVPDGFRNLEALAKASGGAVYRLKKGSDSDTILAGIRSELRR